MKEQRLGRLSRSLVLQACNEPVCRSLGQRLQPEGLDGPQIREKKLFDECWYSGAVRRFLPPGWKLLNSRGASLAPTSVTLTALSLYRVTPYPSPPAYHSTRRTMQQMRMLSSPRRSIVTTSPQVASTSARLRSVLVKSSADSKSSADADPRVAQVGNKSGASGVTSAMRCTRLDLM